jgi:polygalacturonase
LKNITITHSYLPEGDGNVVLKGGAGEVTNMTVNDNHFYWGHGMSIGSETSGGVSGLRVFDLSLDGPDSGIRIKSMGTRGGWCTTLCTTTSAFAILLGRSISRRLALPTGRSKAIHHPHFKTLLLLSSLGR